LKLIGDPETRFREDPVRMLRAARFEAKLNFTIDPLTAEPISNLRDAMSRWGILSPSACSSGPRTSARPRVPARAPAAAPLATCIETITPEL